MRPRTLANDFVLPTLLFVVLGAMTWAVRGCSGYGAVAGCLFAGVTWGTAWWFMARDPGVVQTRRYSSGWIIPAVALGVGLSGGRGWMQWPSFFDGHLQTHAARGEYVPIARTYGFLWMFLAGVPWAGIGACLLAWCAPERRLGAWDWAARLACAFGAAWLADFLYRRMPGLFLPMYRELEARYADPVGNPNLRRLINDNGHAIRHLGFYLGCLGFELLRRDWKNVVLIATVGVLNGLGWAAFQNWSWARSIWPGAGFNFWRCWESSGGISIGFAYGVAYFLVNRPSADGGREPGPDPNGERLAARLGLLLGLGLSVRNGLKGWANIHLGNEARWDALLWNVAGPLLLLGIVVVLVRGYRDRLPRDARRDVFPGIDRTMWMVLVVQNVLAQLVTGPLREWNEMAFAIYYILLFAISAVVVHHVSAMRRWSRMA